MSLELQKTRNSCNKGTSALLDTYVCMMPKGVQLPKASADISGNAQVPV